jgi:hypothetical protein
VGAVPTLTFEDGPPPHAYLVRAQIIGTSELPHFLRLRSPRTASAWQQRGLLPEPDYPSVNGSPAWRRLTILRWIAQTDRVPPWLEEASAPFRPHANGRRRRHLEPAHG